MTDSCRKTLAQYAEALTILAAYSDKGWALDAEHDIIYSHVEKVSAQDEERLEALGWHISSDTECWAAFTGYDYDYAR